MEKIRPAIRGSNGRMDGRTDGRTDGRDGMPPNVWDISQCGEWLLAAAS